MDPGITITLPFQIAESCPCLDSFQCMNKTLAVPGGRPVSRVPERKSPGPSLLYPVNECSLQSTQDSPGPGPLSVLHRTGMGIRIVDNQDFAGPALDYGNSKAVPVILVPTGISNPVCRLAAEEANPAALPTLVGAVEFRDCIPSICIGYIMPPVSTMSRIPKRYSLRVYIRYYVMIAELAEVCPEFASLGTWIFWRLCG
jgi:hypothetical protein